MGTPNHEVAVAIGDGVSGNTSSRSCSLRRVTPPPGFTQGDFDEKNTYTLTFQDLTYKVVLKNGDRNGRKTEKYLLKNISGEARHGELLAIAGPSGAGKSTLLDALAGRITSRSLEGAILANGKPVDAKQFRKLSGYVMQDDALFAHLTVKETLMFSARLRLPGDMPMEVKAARVDMLIATLGLQQCADTRIGNERFQGVSGGEKRRVSIGVDLIHDPSVLFLDEPTSGLDSTSSLNVVQNLYDIATKRKRTILLTIHQPSFRILELLHKIIILSRGSLVYNGTYPNLSSHLTDFGMRVPEHVNVLEFALDVIEELQDAPKGIAALADFQAGRSKLQPSLSSSSNLVQSAEVVFASSPFKETLTLCHRNVINIARTPELFISLLGLMITTGMILGSLFYDVKNDERGQFNRSSFFAFACALPLFGSINALPIFLQERNIFMRETGRGAYRTSSYVVANGLVFLPFYFTQTLIFSVIAYFLVGLVLDRTAFFLFATVMFLTVAVGNTFVTFMSSVVPDFIAGNTIIVAITAFMFLFSGFFIPKTAIPDYWMWFHYISAFKYPLEVMHKVEYDHIDEWSPGLSGKVITEKLGYGYVSTRTNLTVLVGMVVVYRLLFYVSLRLRSSNMRK